MYLAYFLLSLPTLILLSGKLIFLERVRSTKDLPFDELVCFLIMFVLSVTVKSNNFGFFKKNAERFDYTSSEGTSSNLDRLCLKI